MSAVPRAYLADSGVFGVFFFSFLLRACLVSPSFPLSGDQSVEKPTSERTLNQNTFTSPCFQTGEVPLKILSLLQ